LNQILAEPGDSGSPVFTLPSPAKTGGRATHVGVLWSGNAVGTQLVYSPYANIVLASEPGPIAVF